VALLRPTMSPGLYYQMVGRGFRLHRASRTASCSTSAATCCGTGPVDQIKVKEKAAAGTGPRPAKECHECHSVVAAGYAACPDCGFVFPVPERQSHEAAGVGRGRAVRSGDEHEVPRQRRVLQRPHEAQRASED
jgi:DNA repair protein RadD